MNSWTKGFYHTSKGKVLGSISEYNGLYKALLNNVFIGWYITESTAKLAVEESYQDSIEQRKFEDLM